MNNASAPESHMSIQEMPASERNSQSAFMLKLAFQCGNVLNKYTALGKYFQGAITKNSEPR